MKRSAQFSLFYAILAMCSGVFYREFTKLNGYMGETTLSLVHTHLFMLGMFVFLMVTLFNAQFKLYTHKLYKPFMIIYNIGVLLSSALMVTRGTLQVIGFEFSKALDASIAGFSGISHTLIGIGILFFLTALIKCVAFASSQKTLVQ